MIPVSIAPSCRSHTGEETLNKLVLVLHLNREHSFIKLRRTNAMVAYQRYLGTYRYQ
jgi:hypothetical protein